MQILDSPIMRLDGTPTTLGEILDGRLALLVNVASRCGSTPQYTGLEKLQEGYGDEGFSVVGRPCEPLRARAAGAARGGGEQVGQHASVPRAGEAAGGLRRRGFHRGGASVQPVRRTGA